MILFVDEIDGIGDRRTFSGENAPYSTQVVNAFLELVDGVEGREGVVLLAACNHPDRIDPAIRRSGRLDRHVELTLPNVDELAAILAHHLGAENISWLVGAGSDSGASRPGKRTSRARTMGRAAWHRIRSVPSPSGCVARPEPTSSVSPAKRAAGRGRQDDRLTRDDLLAAVSGGRPDATPEQRWRVAVHEAGHAVVTEALGLGTVIEIVLTDGGRAGHTEIRLDEPPALTRAWILDRVVGLLAGRAAEEVILGAPSAGSGGGATSDLAEATRLLLQITASAGLGPRGRLTWFMAPDRLPEGALTSTEVLVDVEQDLQEAYDRAKELVARRVSEVRRLAEELMAKEGSQARRLN